MNSHCDISLASTPSLNKGVFKTFGIGVNDVCSANTSKSFQTVNLNMMV